MRRASVLAIMSALFLSLSAVAPALASAGNDTVATATSVAIPSTTNEDTTAADATDPVETALNANCGAPVVEHGVWFSVTPATDQFVAFDTTGSDYSAGIMLFGATPTAAGLIDCGPNTIIDDLVGGQTYKVLVFGDGESLATSGNLVLAVREAVAPPTVEVRLDRSASVDRHGVVHLTGTAACTSTNGSGNVVEIFGDVTQRVGRLLIHGFFDVGASIACDGSFQPWAADFSGDNGVFAGGKAATVAIAFGCTDLCSEGFVDGTVQLRRSGK